jgi:hypothetical protein
VVCQPVSIIAEGNADHRVYYASAAARHILSLSQQDSHMRTGGIEEKTAEQLAWATCVDDAFRAVFHRTLPVLLVLFILTQAYTRRTPHLVEYNNMTELKLSRGIPYSAERANQIVSSYRSSMAGDLADDMQPTVRFATGIIYDKTEPRRTGYRQLRNLQGYVGISVRGCGALEQSIGVSHYRCYITSWKITGPTRLNSLPSMVYPICGRPDGD